MKKSDLRIPALELVLEGPELEKRVAVVDVEAKEVLIQSSRTDL